MPLGASSYQLSVGICMSTHGACHHLLIGIYLNDHACQQHPIWASQCQSISVCTVLGEKGACLFIPGDLTELGVGGCLTLSRCMSRLQHVYVM